MLTITFTATMPAAITESKVQPWETELTALRDHVGRDVLVATFDQGPHEANLKAASSLARSIGKRMAVAAPGERWRARSWPVDVDDAGAPLKGGNARVGVWVRFDGAKVNSVGTTTNVTEMLRSVKAS